MRYHRLGLIFVAFSLELCPAMAFATDYLGDAQALMSKGDLKSAQIQLRNAVRSDPKSGEARFRLGQVDLMLGDPVSAEKDLRAAKQANPTSPEIIRTLAEAYIAQGRFDAMLKDFTVAGKNPAADSEILVARARAQIYLHQLDQAQESLAEAERLLCPLVAFHIDRAEHGGEHHARAEFRREQLQVEPERAEARFHRRMRQRQQGGHVLVRIIAITPRIHMGGRHDDGLPTGGSAVATPVAPGKAAGR